jgi:hypothetical protein
MNDEKFKLYHYSSKPRTELKTLRQQINEGTIEQKRIPAIDVQDKFYTGWRKELPYSEHISFHIDPLPIDLIKEKFPKDSPYFIGDSGLHVSESKLYEHVIDIRNIAGEQDDIPWRIEETNYDQLMMGYCFSEFLWTRVELYKRSYFLVKQLLAKVLGFSSEGIEKLADKCQPYKGHIRGYFEKWTEDTRFAETSKTHYAAAIPHVILYPPTGIIIPEKVTPIRLTKSHLNP